MKNKLVFYNRLLIAVIFLLCLYPWFSKLSAYHIVSINDNVLKWRSSTTVSFRVNTSGGPSGSLDAIQDAMDTWSDVSSCCFEFNYSGATTSNSHGVNDGINIVTFGNMGDTSTVAQNNYWYSTVTGELLDTDIRLNTNHPFSTDGSSDSFDVETVVLHELGHSLHLGHVEDPSDSEKVMYPYVSIGQIKTSLHQDDINGIRFLYPLDDTEPSLSITSHDDGDTVTSSGITLSGTASDAGRGDYGIYRVTVNGVRASSDTVYDDGTANWYIYVSLGIGANSLTVTATDNSCNRNEATEYITVYYEPPLQPPLPAINPSPGNAATGVAINAKLSWTDGGGATSYDVYFGTDSTPDSGEFKGNQAANTYDPGLLLHSTGYYWRINSKNPDGTTTGNVWYFQTESPPNQIVTVTATDVTALETGSNPGIYRISRNGSTASSLAVYFTMGGSATAGSDYTSISSPEIIPAGASSVNVVLSPIDDAVYEGNEMATMTISTNSAYNRGSPYQASITIQDNDPETEDLWHDWFAVDMNETPMTGDFNGDELIDIITFTRNNPVAFGDVYVALSDGEKFGDNKKWHDWFAISHDEKVVIGDYNGDGIDDIATWLIKTSKQVYVALSTGTGMAQENVWLNSIGFDEGDLLYSGYFNGDSFEDLVLFARSRGEVWVALSTGSGFSSPQLWHDWFAVSTFERPRVGDLNGDGLTDIITFATDSPTARGDVYVAMNDGTRFGDNQKWHDWFSVEPTQIICIGDLDGDLKDDFFTFMTPPSGQVYSVLSQGTQMGPNVLVHNNVAPADTDLPFVGDVNGDGKVDIIVFKQAQGEVRVILSQ